MQALLQLFRDWCGHAPVNTERLPGAASNRQYVRLYAPAGVEPQSVIGVIGQSHDENFRGGGPFIGGGFFGGSIGGGGFSGGGGSFGGGDFGGGGAGSRF